MFYFWNKHFTITKQKQKKTDKKSNFVKNVYQKEKKTRKGKNYRMKTTKKEVIA